MESTDKKSIYVYAAWIISILAFLGSIYYSDFLHIPPCSLCWYQRIAMYPLFFIFPVGIFLKDKKVFYYALPLIVLGFLLSFYQVLLQMGLINNFLVNCGLGVDCAQITYTLFGFLTIPMQSSLAFGALIVLSYLYER